ncbi:AAEL004317-PA [Aedes aegypti]|uniref:AAEL004317-PA n=2 Tax=Aedes aegypti TaxID=7159 RepID=A0A1S4F7J8_AEDAE|nr:terminal uridylyltransferase Tailor [Aedes aegypti]EAT44313.1 AAEL004317-PA [Aedes aegypti]
MSHFHLQLFAFRLNEIIDDYLQRVNWIYEGAVPEIDHLLEAIDSTCSKQHVSSPQSLVFGDIQSCRDIVRFFEPIQCCGKSLLNSDTLMVHLMHHAADEREELDSGTKRTAILFNLFVQLGTGILDRYDNNYDQIEQYTAQLLRKASEYLSCILGKPIRGDAQAAVTFIENVTFAKWKYVFDYTCIPCTNRGIDNCRYEDAIAWYKIHLNTMGSNPIRHLGTKMHGVSLRDCLGDRVVAPTPSVIREVRPSPQLSTATKYLMEVRESELDKLCTIGTAVQRNTPYQAVRAYLQAKLGSILKRSTIEPFGSRVTAVANQNSDLDLAIKVDPSMQPKTAYQKVLAWARANDQEVNVERQIPDGPLVLRLQIHSLQLIVDLTFNSPYVVGNAKIIDYFYRLQPMARKLFFLLKEWKKRTDIGKNFHHNVLTSMIVFYMQTEQYLPPITPLINGPQKVNALYNTEFVELITLYRLPNSFLALVKDFFTYWSRFDWARTGASVKDARVRPRSTFHNVRNPTQPMMITDYFDVTRNVAGNVAPGDCEKFVRACKEAAGALKAKQTI